MQGSRTLLSLYNGKQGTEISLEHKHLSFYLLRQVTGNTKTLSQKSTNNTLVMILRVMLYLEKAIGTCDRNTYCWRIVRMTKIREACYWRIANGYLIKRRSNQSCMTVRRSEGGYIWEWVINNIDLDKRLVLVCYIYALFTSLVRYGILVLAIKYH